VANTGVVAASMALFFFLDGWPLRTLGLALSWGLLGAGLVLAFCLTWIRRRLGGFTGDTLGASQQLAELAILLAWLHVVHPL
jgi:adenosylcobinamide-GDP ribazoletransferase